MGLPYSSIQTVTAPVLNDFITPIKAPPRGSIHRCVVVQLGAGSLNGFTVTLYNAQTTLVGGVPHSVLFNGGNEFAVSTNRPPQVVDSRLVTLGPPIVTAGSHDGSDTAGAFGLDMPYCNQDGGPSNRLALLYMRITGTFAAGTQFGIDLGYEDPSGI